MEPRDGGRIWEMEPRDGASEREPGRQDLGDRAWEIDLWEIEPGRQDLGDRIWEIEPDGT